MPIEVELPDGQIAEFPDSMQPEEIQAVLQRQFGGSPEGDGDVGQTVSGRGISGQQRGIEREQYLSELEETNPFQAQALREMNPFQRALIGAGAGFSDLVRGVTGSEASPSEAVAREQIGESGQAFKAGELIGQAAPFAGAGAVAGTLLRGAPLAARAAAQGAIGATEGGLIARGTGGDAADIATGALIGGTIGGGAEAIAPYVGRVARSIVKKVKGEAPAGRLVDDAGRPTPELNSALEESGQTFDDVVQEASRQQQAESVGSVVRAGRSGNFDSALGDVEASPRRIAAAEAVGIADQTPISVLTEDQAAQELAGALAAVQGTRSSSALDAFAEELGQRADDFIADLGGSTDRGLVGSELLEGMGSDINRIKALEDVLYKRIRDDIGEGTIVNASPIRNVLSARGRTRRGIKNLSKVERDVYERVRDGKITYAELDDVISDIGAALGRETDAYSTVQSSKLSDMYGKLSQLREGVAETFGHANDLKRAKRIGESRFGLQEASQALFGKDLDKSIFPRIDRAVKGLSAGNVKEFEASMELIPEKHRKAVAATMLNTAMTGGRDQSIGVNSGQFAKWYRNLERQPSTMKALKKYVGDDAVNRLDNFAELAKGVAGVTKGRVRTGVTSEALKRLNDVDGVAGKLYEAAQKTQNMPVVGRGAAAVSNAAKMFTLNKTPAVEAADQLLGSTQFKKAAIEAAKSGANTKSFKRLNAQLKASPAYRKYLNQLDPATQSQIAASGLISWLSSDSEEQ